MELRSYMTVRDNAEAEYVDRRSRFIAAIRPVKTEEEALAFIAARKKQHWDARHNVHAYMLRNGISRFSDDGEPQGTAGLPMLETIQKRGITDCVVVVTRYFGGILLGTGGLVRAYTSSVSETCAAAPKLRFCPYDLYRLDVPFKLWGKLEGSIYSVGGMIKSIEYAENDPRAGSIIQQSQPANTVPNTEEPIYITLLLEKRGKYKADVAFMLDITDNDSRVQIVYRTSNTENIDYSLVLYDTVRTKETLVSISATVYSNDPATRTLYLLVNGKEERTQDVKFSE